MATTSTTKRKIPKLSASGQIKSLRKPPALKGNGKISGLSKPAK